MTSTSRRRKAWLLVTTLLIAGAALSQEVSPHIQVAEHEEYGEILVDGEGRSLYLFTRDDDTSSACTDRCAEVWPPVTVDGVVAFGDGVDLGLLGAIARQDEEMQLTYGGQPLYYYSDDSAPGDTAGHGRNDLWFLVSPAGGAAEAGAQDEASAAQEVPMQELMSTGAGVFRRICAECHGPEGASPRVEHAVILADSDRYTSDAGRMIRTVLHGSGYMPGFGNRLSDEEVAAVVTFVRNSWGNDHGPVTVEEVRDMR